MKPLPLTSLEHYCRLHEQAVFNPTSPIDVEGVNSSCIRAMYSRGLIEYEYITVNEAKTRRILFTELGLKYGCELMAHVPNGSKNPRKREWVKMQFNMGDKQYRRAYKVVGELIADNQLAPTVADLLLIHKAAEKGNYKPFYELYGIPETKETSQFATMIQTFADMQQTINTLTAKLDRLQSIPKNTVNEAISSEPPVQREKVHDDGTENVAMAKTKVVTEGNAHMHEFLKSVFSLQEPKEEPAPVGLRAGNVASVPMPVFDDED